MLQRTLSRCQSRKYRFFRLFVGNGHAKINTISSREIVCGERKNDKGQIRQLQNSEIYSTGLDSWTSEPGESYPSFTATDTYNNRNFKTLTLGKELS